MFLTSLEDSHAKARLQLKFVFEFYVESLIVVWLLTGPKIAPFQCFKSSPTKFAYTDFWFPA